MLIIIINVLFVSGTNEIMRMLVARDLLRSWFLLGILVGRRDSYLVYLLGDVILTWYTCWETWFLLGILVGRRDSYLVYLLGDVILTWYTCWETCDRDSYLVYLLGDVLNLAVEDNREVLLESERIGHWCIDELHRFRISTGKKCFVNWSLTLGMKNFLDLEWTLVSWGTCH